MKQSTVADKKVIEHSLTGEAVRPRIHSTDALLNATRQCVLVHGPNVSTTLIADRAGVSQATLFKRFGTKENLFKQALRTDIVFGWIERLEAGPDIESSVRTQLDQLAKALVPFYLDNLHPILAWRATNTWPKSIDRRGDDNELLPPKRGRKALAYWLDKAQRQGRLGHFDADAMAVVYIAGCQAPAFRKYMSGEEIDVDVYIKTFTAGFWSGVAP